MLLCIASILFYPTPTPSVLYYKMSISCNNMAESKSKARDTISKLPSSSLDCLALIVEIEMYIIQPSGWIYNGVSTEITPVKEPHQQDCTI